MAAIQFPPYDSPPTDPNDYLVTPFEAPNGSKWTWGGDAKPRWTAWSEPPLTEIAWGEVTGKPTTFAPSAHTHDDRYYTESEIDTALSGKQPTGDYATNTALNSGLAGKARGIETVGSSQAAVVGGRYITTAAVTITDPTTRIDGSALQNGDSYEVWIGGPGNATIDGVAYVPSRFSIRRARISGAWTTPAATVTGAFNATTIGAGTPGTGAFTTVTASGAVNLSSTLQFNGVTGIARISNQMHFYAGGNQKVRVDDGGFGFVSGYGCSWSSSSSDPAGGKDTSITRNAAGVVQFGTGPNNDSGSWRATNGTLLGTLAVTGATTLTGGYLLGELTVGTLPTASSNTRRRYEVTDSLSPALGATVAAGGSARCTVRSNGTAWIVIQLL